MLSLLSFVLPHFSLTFILIQITLVEPSGRQWMEFYLVSVSTTYVRLNITSTYGIGSVTIKEIELYEGTVKPI